METCDFKNIIKRIYIYIHIYIYYHFLFLLLSKKKDLHQATVADRVTFYFSTVSDWALFLFFHCSFTLTKFNPKNQQKFNFFFIWTQRKLLWYKEILRASINIRIKLRVECVIEQDVGTKCHSLQFYEVEMNFIEFPEYWTFDKLRYFCFLKRIQTNLI